ncbi:FAD-binding oxidoreductase [Thalassobaculum sp.]|uniref:NAD(P)/FAD-dependent oxidoreductase n=1 Tax=Thalassobaculum sp. TaxID=2022740 RepID=UPI0032EE37B6
MEAGKSHTVVVGAGIVGTAIAYHLARRGARVTLIDSGPPGGGVTARAFGWINVSYGTAGPNAPLRGLALVDYRRLDRELGHGLNIDWCGALTWSTDPAETERMVRDHAAHGHDVRLLDRADIARAEPALVDLPNCAAHAVGEGAIDAAAAARTLSEAARVAGAEVVAETAVTAIRVTDRRVAGIDTAAGPIVADTVVLAAGTGSPELCAPLGVAVPIRRSPAIRLRLRTPGPLVNGIVQGPAFEIRQAATTTLYAAEDYIDDSADNGPDAIAGRTLAAIRAGLRGGKRVELQDTLVGLRAIPADGHPIIGPAPSVPGLYLAVMHAGVTLAPTVGRLAAAEILDGNPAPALGHCRPDRFSV